MRKKIGFFLLWFLAGYGAHPLLLDFPPPDRLEEREYTEIQYALRRLNPDEVLDAVYPGRSPFYLPKRGRPVRKKSDFRGRLVRGVNQTMIDLPAGKKPIRKLIRINKGSDRCIVGFASYDGAYPELLQSIPEALERTGFDGYFLLMLGGFPNPTGKEIRYAGVPYCFKIFALLEAGKLGFQKVLWIDASLLPLRDPKPLFDRIERTGCFFQKKKNHPRYLLQKTRDVLLEKTGVDMDVESSVRGRVIGLDLSSKQVKLLLEDYYELTELAAPFISCFPEEFVLGALVAKRAGAFPLVSATSLVKKESSRKKKPSPSKKENSFFLMRKH